MRLEEKRVFINDLPETATQGDIENAFGNYGEVLSVEIKERKELGRKNLSLFFAYVNILVDDKKLQQCFQDFSNGKWLGDYVPLQIARESFLERLKKEREINNVSSKGENAISLPIPKPIEPAPTTNGVVKKKRKYKSSSESNSSDTNDSDNDCEASRNVDKSERNLSNLPVEQNEVPDLVIKSNKGKVIDKTGLKIASVGKEPIIKIDLSKKKANLSEANLKRLESLRNLKKGYQNQKLLIQTALSNVDNTSSKKIIYDESIRSSNKKSKSNQENTKKSIFDGDESEEDFESNFSIKEQFQGEKGQKLFELQSRYKNDERFALDSRFLESEDEQMEGNQEENEEVLLEQEKNKEYEILENVLGKKINKMQKQSDSQRKKMLRFDPSQPEHSKYEMPKTERKIKDKISDIDLSEEKTKIEKEVPIGFRESCVSEENGTVEKEVPVVFKESYANEFKESSQGFSLLSMFGKAQDVDEVEEQDLELKRIENKKSTEKPMKSIANELVKERNPFQYDSSDDEDETGDIPTQTEVDQRKELETRQQADTRRNIMWSDPFFFRVDDYRLQEGFDFLEKMKSEEKTEFTKLRRNLKEIVKAKMKNNQRKNKLFKKKLGGSRKKKVIRMKKAMKR